jgi:hypothetical protein
VIAAGIFPDETFDMVYVDGDHKYGSVLTDMVLWWGKVRRGGYLAGHDYHKDWPEVIKAVDHYCRMNHLQRTLMGTSDWMILKQ